MRLRRWAGAGLPSRTWSTLVDWRWERWARPPADRLRLWIMQHSPSSPLGPRARLAEVRGARR